MQTVQNGQNTERVISNDKLISEGPPKGMATQKKVIIGVIAFITIGAIVGIALGLYFHFRPSSTHIQTVVGQTNDGVTTYSSTKFVYTDNNMVGKSYNQTFTIMFAGLNGDQVQRRMLQSAQQQSHADTTLHYTHDSGIKIKFRGNQVLNISVPIDQVLEYMVQNKDPVKYARLLEELTQYDGEDENFSGSDIFDEYRSQVQNSIQSIYNNTDSVHVHMKDVDIYELRYDQNLGGYRYSNATNVKMRRLWKFGNFFHEMGDFVKNVAHGIVNFVKNDGSKILKYGAIAALAGVDILAEGPTGVSNAVNMFKSGNVLTSLQMAAEGVATLLPPYISIPIDFIGHACFSHPPAMHCTGQAALNAVKETAVDVFKKHAVETVISLFV